jgi:hypothetical protein
MPENIPDPRLREGDDWSNLWDTLLEKANKFGRTEVHQRHAQHPFLSHRRVEYAGRRGVHGKGGA